MELTESPISEDVLFLNREEGLDTVRAWWEGVASGETDVSFAGSGIGFRFHPDGSFEEVSMAKRAIVRELPPSPPSEEISSESSFQRLWFVFFGVLAGGAAFVVYKIRYRTRR